MNNKQTTVSSKKIDRYDIEEINIKQSLIESLEEVQMIRQNKLQKNKWSKIYKQRKKESI